MKKSFIVLVLLVSSVTSFAARGGTPVSAESLEILEAVSHCASTLQLLSASGHIGRATILKGQNLDIYKITFVTGGYAPNFEKTVTGELEIRKSFQRSDTVATEAPDKQVVYKCFNLE